MTGPSRSPAHPADNTLDELRVLLRASLMTGGVGVALQLCILAGLRPGEAVGAKLEDVDWRHGVLNLPMMVDASGERVASGCVALSYTAQATILRAAGGIAGSGQILTGGMGVPISVRELRTDLVRRLLEAAELEAKRVAWDWRTVRNGTGQALRMDGFGPDAVSAFLGRTSGPIRSRVGAVPPDLASRSAMVNRWARLLLPPAD